MLKDKTEFDNLLYTKFDFTKQDIHEINTLIDNDSTITQELFRRQFVNDYSKNNEVPNEYLDFDGNKEAFYQYVKDLLIKNNNFISKTNTYNSEKELGIPPNEFRTQYEIEKIIEDKNNAINKEETPEKIIQEELEKKKASEEYKAELSREEFSNQKSVLIDEMYTWFGEVKADGSYPTNQEICSKKFEISKVILDYLKLNDFRTFKAKISSGDQKEFMERYNYFKDIFSGKAYAEKITQDNDLYKFIMSLKQTNESFRSYIIKLCEDTKTKCSQNYKKKFPNLNYKDIYEKDLNKIIKDSSGVAKYKSNSTWPVNLSDKYVVFTNDQLIIIYQYVLSLHIGTYTGSGILPNKTTEIKNGERFSRIKPSEQRISNKYFVDTDKLNNGILELRYNKNRHLTNVKSQVIGNGLKSMLKDVIYNDRLDESQYPKLTPYEQNLISTILHMIDKKYLISDTNGQFQERFQIILGEWSAENNSDHLRNELKQYIIHALKINLISRTLGTQMLVEMMN